MIRIFDCETYVYKIEFNGYKKHGNPNPSDWTRYFDTYKTCRTML